MRFLSLIAKQKDVFSYLKNNLVLIDFYASDEGTRSSIPSNAFG